jgi:hypothetical protein
MKRPFSMPWPSAVIVTGGFVAFMLPAVACAQAPSQVGVNRPDCHWQQPRQLRGFLRSSVKVVTTDSSLVAHLRPWHDAAGALPWHNDSARARGERYSRAARQSLAGNIVGLIGLGAAMGALAAGNRPTSHATIVPMVAGSVALVWGTFRWKRARSDLAYAVTLHNQTCPS